MLITQIFTKKTVNNLHISLFINLINYNRLMGEIQLKNKKNKIIIDKKNNFRYTMLVSLW